MRSKLLTERMQFAICLACPTHATQVAGVSPNFGKAGADVVLRAGEDRAVDSAGLDDPLLAVRERARTGIPTGCFHDQNRFANINVTK